MSPFLKKILRGSKSDHTISDMLILLSEITTGGA